MKHEIIQLNNVQIIGMARQIASDKGQEECPKFWAEYVAKIVKPVFIERQTPTPFQQAALDNGVGEFGICTCTYPDHNCMLCGSPACPVQQFTYVIGGTYRGGDVPEGMQLFSIPSGRWLKVHFVGGMAKFHEQYRVFSQWMKEHPEYKCRPDGCCMEWYAGTDIQSPDYQCGVMIPIL